MLKLLDLCSRIHQQVIGIVISKNNVLVIYHLIERNILYMNTTNNRNDFYKEQLDKTLNGNEKIETAIAGGDDHWLRRHNGSEF